MQLDPIIPVFVATILALAVFGLLMRIARQPLLIGYVLTGLVIGPAGLSLITDLDVMSRLGAAGVVLLLFFIGMAVSPSDLRDNWKVALIGTSLQIVLSTMLVIGIGEYLNWPLNRSVLLGFVIAMSSTAIVMKLLEDQNMLSTPMGQDAASITLVQDLAVIPMILILSLMSGETISPLTLTTQTIAALGFLVLMIWLSSPRVIRLPYGQIIEEDHELQVLLAVAFCFGLGLVASLMGLSTAFGAFVAGMLLRVIREAKWVESSLSGFRVIFVALFFASVGMLVDLKFLTQHWTEVALLAGIVIVVNTVLVATIIKALGRDWGHSFYVASMVSQIGEFSFVLAAVGIASGIIGAFAYQMTISVIVVTLVLSPAWVFIIKKLSRVETGLPGIVGK